LSAGDDGRGDYSMSETEIIACSEAGNVVAGAVVVNPAVAKEATCRLPGEALLAGRAVSDPERDLGAAAAAAWRAILLRTPALRVPQRAK
jgi:hypothetical protein